MSDGEILRGQQSEAVMQTGHWANGTATMFLFDWDDTLHPTTAISDVDQSNLPELLREIDVAAAHALSLALAIPYSHVTLLTNAEEAWVWMTAQRMPLVQQLLLSGNIAIVSAYRPLEVLLGESEESTAFRRQMHESASIEWKNIAVAQRLAVPYCEALRIMQTTSVQVVTVGDRAHDMEAGRTLATFLRTEADQVFVKAVRMLERPSIPELLAETSLLGDLLASLCQQDGNVNCSLAEQMLKDPLVHQNDALGKASLTQVTGKVARAGKRSLGFKSHDVRTGVKISISSKQRGHLRTGGTAGCKHWRQFGASGLPCFAGIEVAV